MNCSVNPAGKLATATAELVLSTTGLNQYKSENAQLFQAIEQKCKNIADKDGKVDLENFKKVFQFKKKDSLELAQRFFKQFNKDESGLVEVSALIHGLQVLRDWSPKQRFKFIFDVYDIDGDGFIKENDLRTVLKSSLGESSITVSDEVLDELSATLFQMADKDGSEQISFENFYSVLESYPEVLKNLTISAVDWLKPLPEKNKTEKRSWHTHKYLKYLTWRYHVNNRRKVIFLIFYMTINIGLFFSSVGRYSDRRWCKIIARACGMPLNFNCAFVVVLMLRNSLTWLRSTRLGSYLPLDQSVWLHKLVGYMIAVLATVHSVAHLFNLGYIVASPENSLPNGTDIKYWEYLFTLKGQAGWLIEGFAYPSGVILVVILFVMVACSVSYIRQKGYFQVFYWTHMLYVFFWAFLILHGPIFWYFFIIPGSIFIVEKILNSRFCKLFRYGKVYIKEVNLLASRVTHLVIDRPGNFHYKPGDYVFINIPDVAQHEWHPFTISSAPELTGDLWLHVRSVGNWTNKLYEYVKEYHPLEPDEQSISINLDDQYDRPKSFTFSNIASRKGHNSGEINEAFEGGREESVKIKRMRRLNEEIKVDKTKYKHKMVKIQVYIDGPYGTATREIFETEHAVLIGSGIGVTPFASILQSIMYRYNFAKQKCPKCEHMWYGQLPASILKMKKVDFIWINRDQKAFEWFISLLAQLEMNQTIENQQGDSAFDSFLEMQMYMTAAVKKVEMKGLALQMAIEMIHQKAGRDVLTGLKTRTQPGRPNFKKVFQKISQQKKGRVKVFFCGNPALASTLKHLCAEFGFDFAKENF